MKTYEAIMIAVAFCSLMISLLVLVVEVIKLVIH